MDFSKEDTLFEGFGLLGVLEAHTASYLLLVKSAKFIGCILKSEIYRVEEVLYLPFISRISSSFVNDEDNYFIKLYEDFLKRNSLYFSDTYDLTNSIKGFYQNISNIMNIPRIDKHL